MKLVERELGIQIELKEDIAAVLVVEDISFRLSLVEELYQQMSGKDGNWLLVENEKTYDFSKSAEMILEPFTLQLNNKKIKTKLYQDLKHIADETFCIDGIELHSHISNFLEKLVENAPYPIRYNDEWNVLELLKMYGVEIEDMSDNLVEKVFQYIKMMNQVCNISIFFALNLRQYLTENQRKELYKLAQYSKIQLVLIEFDICGNKLDEEEVYILDQDDCIISY